MGTVYKYKGLQVVKGNAKIGNDTLILNMGTATDCPSAKLGLCKLGKKCYALKAEKLYPTCKPFREKQAAYWASKSGYSMFVDFSHVLNKHKRALKDIKYLRFNESGDFYCQTDVIKLDTLAWHLKKHYGIITYGYTARKDLDFSNVSFLVKGSSHDKGNNGKTIAMPKRFIESQGFQLDSVENKIVRFSGKAFTVCPMNCRGCKLCKELNGKNIVFPLH